LRPNLFHYSPPSSHICESDVFVHTYVCTRCVRFFEHMCMYVRGVCFEFVFDVYDIHNICMFVCVWWWCVCVCVCVRACVRARAYICIYVSAYSILGVCLYMHVCMRAYTSIFGPLSLSPHTKSTYTHTHTQNQHTQKTYTHTQKRRTVCDRKECDCFHYIQAAFSHTHTYMHTYIHTTYIPRDHVKNSQNEEEELNSPHKHALIHTRTNSHTLTGGRFWY
jgi:hypothetical protein